MDRAVFPIKLNNPDLLRSQSYLNGQWVDAKDGGVFAVDNPATGGHIAHVANLGADLAHVAVDAASAAFPAWRARTAKERSAILRKNRCTVAGTKATLPSGCSTSMRKIS